jgi:hypothetical protein
MSMQPDTCNHVELYRKGLIPPPHSPTIVGKLEMELRFYKI